MGRSDHGGVRSVNGALVDHQPIQAQSFDDLPELLEIDRLLDIAVNPQVVALNQVSLLAGGCHDDHRNRLGSRIILQFSKHLQAINSGQFQIEQNQFGRMSETSFGEGAAAEKKVQSFFAVPDDKNVVGQL